MGNYRDNNRSGGRDSGGRSSGGYGGGGRSGGFGGGRSGGRPEMHQATCADCGNRCEVPFRPTGDKPVYCSSCFGGGNDRSRDSRPSRFDKSDFGDFKRKDFGRSDSEERKMYKVTCDDCGDKCEVPFKPSGDKPVYCSSCFGGAKDKDFSPKKSSNCNEQHEELNKKLDKIIKILEIIKPKKEFIIKKSEVKESSVKEEAEEKPVVAKKAPAVKKAKAVAKKVVAKKAPAKKVVAKKAPVKKVAAKKKPAAKKKK